MPNHQIVWCAFSSMHYIIEGPTRYAMPLYLAIQMKEYLKKCNSRSADCVANWVSNLSPADRISVKISDAQQQPYVTANHSNIPLRSTSEDIGLTSFRG